MSGKYFSSNNKLSKGTVVKANKDTNIVTKKACIKCRPLIFPTIPISEKYDLLCTKKTTKNNAMCQIIKEVNNSKIVSFWFFKDVTCSNFERRTPPRL